MTSGPGTPDDPEEQIELGDEVTSKRERPSGPVLAIRMPRDVLAKLSVYASERGTTVSDVVRQAAIRLVTERSVSGPFYFTGSPLEGPNLVSEVSRRGGSVMNRDYEGHPAAISRTL